MLVGISGLLITEDGTPVGTAGAGKDTFADLLVSIAGYTKVSFADPLKRIARDVYRFTDEQLWGPSAMRNQLDTRYPRHHTWVDDPPVKSSDSVSCICCGAQGRNMSVLEEALFRAPRATTWEKDDPQCYLTPRYVLQLLGTEFGRHCYNDTWVQYAASVSQDLLQNPYARYNVKRGVYVETTSYLGSATVAVAIPDVRFRNEVEGLRSRGAKLVRIKRVSPGLANASGMHPSERESTLIPDSAFDVVIDNNGTIEELAVKVKEFVNNEH